MISEYGTFEEQISNAKLALLIPGDAGVWFENGLFGVNAEITRKQFFGGLSAQLLNNRKLCAGKDMPCGWECSDFEYVTDRKNESLCDSNFVILKNGYMRQTSDIVALQDNREYEAKLWIKDVSDKVVVTFGVEGHEREFIVNSEGEKYQELSFVFAGRSIKNGTFSIRTNGEAAVFEASLMPTDHFYGMRREIVEALKYIAPTSIRFPGGCAADHFDWHQSLKAPEFRKPVIGTNKWFLLPDTYDQDCLDIGLNEFIMLCREVGAEPEYTVSLLLSDGKDARCLVEYCNGGENTEYGAIRQSLGFEAFAIKLWYVGNEAYFFGGEYEQDGVLAAKRTNELMKGMKQADQNIDVVIGLTWAAHLKKWNHDFVVNVDDQYEYISYHNYIGILPDSSQGLNGMATCEILETNFLDGEDIGLNFYKNELYAGKFDDIEICADEWNYTWGRDASNGLFFSNALQFHFFAKSSEKYHIRKAQFFAPVNEGMITVKGAECTIESTGELFRYMAKHKGGRMMNCGSGTPELDVLCTEHNDKLFMSVVNRSSTPYKINVKGYRVEACTQIRTGKYSFSNNDFELIKNEEPTVCGHSVIFIELGKCLGS